jgi:hypothetical protein
MDVEKRAAMTEMNVEPDRSLVDKSDLPSHGVPRIGASHLSDIPSQIVVARLRLADARRPSPCPGDGWLSSGNGGERSRSLRQPSDSDGGPAK